MSKEYFAYVEMNDRKPIPYGVGVSEEEARENTVRILASQGREFSFSDRCFKIEGEYSIFLYGCSEKVFEDVREGVGEDALFLFRADGLLVADRETRLSVQQRDKLLKDGFCWAASDTICITGKELKKEQETWDVHNASKHIAFEDDAVYWWGDHIEKICSLSELEEMAI